MFRVHSVKMFRGHSSIIRPTIGSLGGLAAHVGPIYSVFAARRAHLLRVDELDVQQNCMSVRKNIVQEDFLSHDHGSLKIVQHLVPGVCIQIPLVLLLMPPMEEVPPYNGSKDVAPLEKQEYRTPQP